MSAAKKSIVDLVPMSAREEIVAEYKSIASEKSRLEADARKLKKDAEALKAKVLLFVKDQPEMQARIGRFNVSAARRTTQSVNIEEARQTFKGEALRVFNSLIRETEWFQVDVDVVDQVGEILDKMEKGS